jgi:hypothetical protein
MFGTFSRGVFCKFSKQFGEPDFLFASVVCCSIPLFTIENKYLKQFNLNLKLFRNFGRWIIFLNCAKSNSNVIVIHLQACDTVCWQECCFHHPPSLVDSWALQRCIGAVAAVSRISRRCPRPLTNGKAWMTFVLSLRCLSSPIRGMHLTRIPLLSH